MDFDEDDRGTFREIATILGIALVFVFVVVVVVRKLYFYRVNRLARTRARGPQVNVELVGFDHEPRTIALGARAALLKKPVLLETHLVTLSDPKVVQTWSHLQPMNLQLTTPHTTANFPTKSVPSSQAQGPGRLRRLSLSNPRSNSVLPATNANSNSPASNTLLAPTTPQRQSPLAPRSLIAPSSHDSEVLENTASEQHPHPVHVSFLISMPNPSSPSFSSTKYPPNSKALLHTQIPPLELGTTSPIVQLNSISISQAELDSWWNLPFTSRGRLGQLGRQTERIRDLLGFSFQNYP